MRNFERLTELLNVLKSIPEENFSLDHWIQTRYSANDSTEELVKCGTVACAVGWACLHKPFQDLGLRLSKDDDRWSEIEVDEDNYGIKSSFPVYQEKVGWGAISRFFSLDTKEATYIFAKESYQFLYTGEFYEPSVRDVIARIEKLLQYGELWLIPSSNAIESHQFGLRVID